VPNVQTDEAFPTGSRAREWDRLVAEDPAGTVFHSARFLRLWCRHLRGECDLRLRTVTEAGAVLGVVPEVREPRDGLRTAHFSGGLHVTDYLGPVSRPEHRGPVVEGWLDTLAGERDWDVLVAGALAEDAGWHGHIAGQARRRGFDVAGPTAHDVCPRIDLTGGWDAYLARLQGKQRHEIRRKARRLAREAGVVKIDEVDPDDQAPALHAFAAAQRGAWARGQANARAQPKVAGHASWLDCRRIRPAGAP
jgi:hypothetical protein